MTKMYIAGSWAAREYLISVREQLEEIGLTVTSGWLNETTESKQESAVRDIDDIARADVIVIDVSEPSVSGGYHTELGWAICAINARIGRLKECWVINADASESIFIHYPTVNHADSWDSFIAYAAEALAAGYPPALPVDH